jgi:membrane fusion protein (multidrug efflux system)
MIAAPAAILLIALYIFLTGGRYVSTDDAYIQAARVNVSSNIPGRVVAVEVRENQFVKTGQVLFRLDPQPLDTALAESQAQLSAAKLQVDSLKAAYGQRAADLKSAEDQAAYRARELARQKELFAAGVASQQQVDQAQNASNTAQQQVAAAREALASVKASLGGSPDIRPDQHPAVRQAAAVVARNQLNKSYAVVAAAQDGVVTKVEQLQVGDYVNAAQPLFSLVSPRVWVDANFKEDQLGYVRPGQPVRVTVDARKGVVYHGKVASLSPGTGASFSILPAENASGNWVKVVQRLTVRIVLDEQDLAQEPLEAGLSAKVVIDTGPHNPLFGKPPKKPAPGR